MGGSKVIPELSSSRPHFLSILLVLYGLTLKIALSPFKTLLLKPNWIQFQLPWDFSPSFFCYEVHITSPIDTGNSSLSLVWGESDTRWNSRCLVVIHWPFNDSNFRSLGFSYQFYMSTFLLGSPTPSLTSWGNSKGAYQNFSIPKQKPVISISQNSLGKMKYSHAMMCKTNSLPNTV